MVNRNVQSMAAAPLRSPERSRWTDLDDSRLLAQCHVDTYRASGPGGQKRNKTSSAVRLRHGPSGLMVIAEESRSQHENRQRALRRLRQALFLRLRNDFEVPETFARTPGWQAVCPAGGRLTLSRKDLRFWPGVGMVLDILTAAKGSVSNAANWLAISTANLVDFLATEPKVWQEANRIRIEYGLKPLVHRGK
jgi:RF-1 domain